MDQTDLEQPTPETTAKDSNQSYVVKLLRDITLAEATGKFADSICLSVNSFIHQLYVIRRTMNLAIMLTFIKHHHCFSEKLTYKNRSLWCKIEKFIKSRFPCRPFLLEVPCMNLGPCLRKMHSFSSSGKPPSFFPIRQNLLQMVQRNFKCPHQPEPDIRSLVSVC